MVDVWMCVCVLGRFFFCWDFAQPHSGQIIYLDTEQSQEIHLSPIQTSMHPDYSVNWMLFGLKLKRLRQNKVWIGNTARNFYKYLYNSSSPALSAPSQAMCPCNILPAGVTVHVRHFCSPQLTEMSEHKQFLCRRITEGWVKNGRAPKGSQRQTHQHLFSNPCWEQQGNLTLFKEFGSVILHSVHWILTTFISSTLLHLRKKQSRNQEWTQAAKCSCGSRPSRGGTELSTHTSGLTRKGFQGSCCTLKATVQSLAIEPHLQQQKIYF